MIPDSCDHGISRGVEDVCEETTGGVSIGRDDTSMRPDSCDHGMSGLVCNVSEESSFVFIGVVVVAKEPDNREHASICVSVVDEDLLFVERIAENCDPASI